MSLVINDLPDHQQDDLGGTLKLGNYTVAGRLSHFKQAWSSITTDQWVLEIVSNGYALLFIAPPPLASEPLEMPLPTIPQRREALWTEVQSLLDKGAVEEIPLGIQGVCVCVLLSLLPRVKENRRISSHIKSRGTQCLPPREEVQDGNCGIDSRSAASHVDDLSGLEGCLHSRSYHSTPQ